MNRSWLEYRPTGARVRCLGSDPKKAHGLRSWLALLDEPAQWDTAKRDAMLAAIRTGLGKSPGSRLVALGTRPADDSHWFARMLKSAAYSQVHAAGPDDPPFQVRTIRRANPSWDHLPSLRDRIQREIADAKKDPDMLASFKSLRLNLGTSDTVEAVLIDPESWTRIETNSPIERSGGYALGIDAGTTAAMSAASAFWPSSGAADAFAVLPAEPSLATKGLSDGVGRLYLECQRRNELLVAGQYISDLAELLREAMRRWGPPGVIVCDRWREAELREKLQEVDFPMIPLVIRGQGFRDGGEDVRTFRKVAIDGLACTSAGVAAATACGRRRPCDIGRIQ